MYIYKVTNTVLCFVLQVQYGKNVLPPPLDSTIKYYHRTVRQCKITFRSKILKYEVRVQETPPPKKGRLSYLINKSDRLLEPVAGDSAGVLNTFSCPVSVNSLWRVSEHHHHSRYHHHQRPQTCTM